MPTVNKPKVKAEQTNKGNKTNKTKADAKAKAKAKAQAKPGKQKGGNFYSAYRLWQIYKNNQCRGACKGDESCMVQCPQRPCGATGDLWGWLSGRPSSGC